MTDYTVRRYDAESMTVEQRRDVIDWIAGLGHDPNRILPRLAITHGTDGHTLHLSRKVQRIYGSDIVDVALDKVWSEPVYVPVQRWPASLDAVQPIDPQAEPQAEPSAQDEG